MTDSTTGFHDLEKEVQRKIGRNLWIYQLIEAGLKYFVSISRISGSVGDKPHMERKEEIHNSMMGIAAAEFFRTYFLDSLLDESPSLAPTTSFIRISRAVIVSSDLHGERRLEMRTVIEDRNELVHGLVALWNRDSLESTQAMERYLDEKRERAMRTLEFLKELRTNLFETSKEMESSPELRHRMLGGRVMDLLLNFTHTRANANGCVSVDAVRNIIHQHAHDELAKLLDHFNYGSLQEFIAKCGWFEINDELSNKGGKRTVYRLKPGMNVQLEET